MTTEEAIERGALAGAILENEAIMFFLKDEMDRIKEASFNTLPEDGKRRSELFYQHYALTEFLSSLTAYRQAADEILAELEAEESQKEVD